MRPPSSVRSKEEPSRPAPTRASGNIILCEREHAIDWPVVTWRDDPRWDASRESCHRGADRRPTDQISPYGSNSHRVVRRYSARPQLGGRRDLLTLQRVLDKFVIHYDGEWSADSCFHDLHDERGLSSHFLIDNDGTIYQTLDLVHMGWHAKGANGTSIGVEICNRGVYLPHQDAAYQRNGYERERERVLVRTHGHEVLEWGFTSRQMQAMVALGRALARLLPNLPAAFPCSGEQLIRTALEDVDSFSGYLGHYHITRNKRDPGGFDFARLTAQIRPQARWFLCPPGESPAPATGECVLPDEPQRARAQGDRLAALNEDGAGSGFFPIGPCGATLLWHGGVHIPTRAAAPVRCPVEGEIVTARHSPASVNGSTSYVLTRHRLLLAGQAVEFFFLFYHLDLEPRNAPPGAWWSQLRPQPWSREGARRSSFPQRPVAAGALLGLSGRAGLADGAHSPQAHVEVLATADLVTQLSPGRFEPIDAAAHDLAGSDAAIRRALQQRGFSGIERIRGAAQLRRFIRESPESTRLRRLAVRCRSEWGESQDALWQLQQHPELARYSEASIRNLFEVQIQPHLWWTQEVAARTGLPRDHVAWHYHPIEFLLWLDETLRVSNRAAARAAARFPAGSDAAASPSLVHGGDDFYTADDVRMEQATRREYTLDQLQEGYGDE